MQICMGGVLLPSIDLMLRDCSFKTLKLSFGPDFLILLFYGNILFFTAVESGGYVHLRVTSTMTSFYPMTITAQPFQGPD
jgi:hypothetical protein